MQGRHWPRPSPPSGRRVEEGRPNGVQGISMIMSLQPATGPFPRISPIEHCFSLCIKNHKEWAETIYLCIGLEDLNHGGLGIWARLKSIGLSVGDGDGQFYLFCDGNWSTTCEIRGLLYSNWRAAPAASKYSICRWWFMNWVGWVLQALARFHSFCTLCNLPPLMYRSTGIAGEMGASIYVFFGMQAYACMVTKGTSQTGRRPGPCRHVLMYLPPQRKIRGLRVAVSWWKTLDSLIVVLMPALCGWFAQS
jgi:hypothetical protein